MEIFDTEVTVMNLYLLGSDQLHGTKLSIILELHTSSLKREC